MIKLMGKKIFTILHRKGLFILACDITCRGSYIVFLLSRGCKCQASLLHCATGVSLEIPSHTRLNYNHIKFSNEFSN